MRTVCPRSVCSDLGDQTFDFEYVRIDLFNKKRVALRARMQDHPNRTNASEDQPCAIGVEWLHQSGIVAESIFLNQRGQRKNPANQMTNK